MRMYISVYVDILMSCVIIGLYSQRPVPHQNSGTVLPIVDCLIDYIDFTIAFLDCRAKLPKFKLMLLYPFLLVEVFVDTFENGFLEKF